MTSPSPSPPDPRLRLLSGVPLLILTAAVAVSAIALIAVDRSQLPSSMIGKPAPDFALNGLDGKAESGLARHHLIGETPAIVNVWASWCAPCRAEHPNLVLLAERDLRLFGVNYRDRPENARSFLDKLGNPFRRIGVDPKGRLAVAFGVYGVPETFILDADGVIRYRHAGPIDAKTLNDKILPLLDALADRRLSPS